MLFFEGGSFLYLSGPVITLIAEWYLVLTISLRGRSAFDELFTMARSVISIIECLDVGRAGCDFSSSF